jgi:hypothetical protein
MKLTGECFCGSVKYEIDGGVHSARSCHCSRCRKAFSAQASAYALVDPKTFSWLQGEELLTTYPPDGQFGKRFCRKCGATLCGVVDGEIHGITLGCLNEDKGIQIEAHIFVASKAEWEVLPDGVSQFDAYPPEWLSRT